MFGSKHRSSHRNKPKQRHDSGRSRTPPTAPSVPSNGRTAAPPASESSPPLTVNGQPWIKHPLEHAWKFWYLKNEPNRDWKDSLTEVLELATVEDFWALHTHVRLASGLSSGSDYSLFKRDIMPMWEDSNNRNGGKWVITVYRDDRFWPTADQVWLNTLLCMIGESFGESEAEQVCGAVISARPKFHRVSLWTRDVSRVREITSIGATLKKWTGFGGEIYYQSHSAPVKNREVEHLLKL